MRYVLDCNVALKWFLPEAYSETAYDIFLKARRGEISLIAPDVLFAEFGHGLRKYIIGERLTGERALAIWQRLTDSGLPAAIPSKDLGERALALVIQYHSTFYDALYLALAERENLKVLTADGPMVNAFAKLNRTIHLADYVSSPVAE